MAELVDAPDSKSGARKGVGVRFPPSALRLAVSIVRRPRASRSPRALLAGLAAAGLAAVASGCGGSQVSACAQVEYTGTGDPDLVVVSDLPLQGAASRESRQINDAIRAQLQERGFRAGAHTIGFQACDDSTAVAGKSDPGVCASNAAEYADDDSKVIGVIGPLDSRCAAILIPVLNLASGGGIPIVSPTNTYPCLTRGGAGCDLSEPGKYYPSGARNYLRVVGNDVFQGAAAAEFAREKGVRRVYVLHDNEAYGVGMATSFRGAARKLGIEVVGFEGWHSAATSHTSLFERVKGKRADAVFLGGLIGQNGARVIEDKVRVLGPNDGDVRLLASDGFAKQQTIDRAGAAANGMYVVAAGVPVARLPAAAKRFTTAFAARSLGGRSPHPSAIYGAQAAKVMLDAIATSNGTRGDVTARLFGTEVTDGLLGTFGFDANGDPADASGPVVGFTIFKVARGLQVETVIDPEGSSVRAAAGG